MAEFFRCQMYQALSGQTSDTEHVRVDQML